MDVIEAIKNRRSIRWFDKDKEVPEATLREIVALAQRAPSWVDSQPWRVYLATGESLKALRQRHLDNVASGREAATDWPTTHRTDWDPFPQANMAKHNEATAAYLNTPELKELRGVTLQKQLFDAPAIAYLTLPKISNQWSIYDLGAFGQTLALAAQGLGVSSMPAYEFVKYPDEVRAVMGIPDDQWVVMGIGLGYPKDHYVNGYDAPRCPLDQVLTLKK